MDNFAPKGNLSVSVTFWLSNWGRNAMGVYWIENKEASVHSASYRIACHNNKLPSLIYP